MDALLSDYDLRRQNIRAHIQDLEKKHSMDKRYKMIQTLRNGLRGVDREEYYQNNPVSRSRKP